MRFVLVHLGPGDQNTNRKKAIQNAFTIARQKLVMIEHDWSTLGGNQNIDDFRELSLQTAPHLNMHLTIGATLAEETVESLRDYSDFTLIKNKIIRKPGHYYQEIEKLIQALTLLLAQVHICPSFLQRAKDLREKLKADSKKPELKFTPAAINVVRVYKKK